MCAERYMSRDCYVHGYSQAEACRLGDQADTLGELLHHDSIFPPKSRVLEVGCGTGAQTRTLAAINPECRFVSIDISQQSVAAARKRMASAGISNVDFRVADIFDLPFEEESFDHVFVCFLLEHLDQPVEALRILKGLLKTGGTITVIEGDHGSAYYHPRSTAAQANIQCLIDVQASLGGNALIGRELYPLLVSGGFRECRVSPRFVYADASRPGMVDGFTRKTFTAMVAGVREQAISRGLIDATAWRQGIADLNRTAQEDGTFCYTFFKATGVK